MRKIVVIGAGRSSGVLIRHLLSRAAELGLQIIVADNDLDLAAKCVHGQANGTAIELNIMDEAACSKVIETADLVVSMVPPRFHYRVVAYCLKHKVSLVNASYQASLVQIENDGNEVMAVQERSALNELDKQAKKAGIGILCEVGLDPGLDHLSAMAVIDEIQLDGGILSSFKSYTGGLVAEEYDNNPWHYKFTWNPRNVVLAGQGVAQFIRNGRYKHIPYHKVFTRIEKIMVPGAGEFEGYPNRDSLAYRATYGLDNIPTLLRGTLRRPGFCSSWQLLVDLGMTDDSYMIEDAANMTYRDFTNSFTPYEEGTALEEKICSYFKLETTSEEFKNLEWLGLFSDKKLKAKIQSPARILQDLLEEKWQLEEGDKDMIVMQHRFEFEKEGTRGQRNSSLVVFGDDQDTAMAKTVGYPAAIAALLMIEGKIQVKGIEIPLRPEIYKPVLAELAAIGIKFSDEIN